MVLPKARSVVDSFLLLAAGGIATAFALLIASQRLDFVDEELATWVLLFVPWQILGLSIAKFGVDQLTFARVTANGSLRILLKPVFWKCIVPVACVFSLVTTYLYESALIGLVAGMSIAADAVALAFAADVNARGRFRYVALASLANHPFFFAAFVVLSWMELATPSVVAGTFLLASMLRLVILWPLYARERPTTLVQLSNQGMLAVQQILNYSVFRADQIIVNVLAAKLGLIAYSLSDVEQFVYLVRLPEIFIGISGALTPLYLPWIHRVFGSSGDTMEVDAEFMQTLVLAGLLVVAIALAAAAMFVAWGGRNQIEVLRVLPFVAFSLLVFPANYVTYRAMRSDALGHLVRLLGLSLCCGLALLLASWGLDSFSLLLWIVPVQLAAFVLLGAGVIPLISRPRTC